MKHELVSDEKLYDDLVNNFKQFHIHNSESDLLDFHGKWDDDSDYSDYRTIEDLLENLTEEDLDRTYVVRCPISYIFSSDKGDETAGFDRTLWSVDKKTGRDKNIRNLTKYRGFVAEHCGILSVRLRYDEKTNKWQISKNKGNNRLVMKLLANDGHDSTILVELRFHKQDMSWKEQQRIEAQTHSADAEDRNSQNEDQKFFSSYRAEEEPALECFQFMKKYNLDYNGIMKQEKVATEGRINLTSLKGFKDGITNGYFKKFGHENVVIAVSTISEIARDITKETTVASTSIESFALMFDTFTTKGGKKKDSVPLFTKESLKEFFLEFFREKNRMMEISDKHSRFKQKKPTSYKLNNLANSGAIKNTYYISVVNFFGDPNLNLHLWFMSDDDKERKYGLGPDSFATNSLIRGCKDPHLIKEAKRIISG